MTTTGNSSGKTWTGLLVLAAHGIHEPSHASRSDVDILTKMSILRWLVSFGLGVIACYSMQAVLHKSADESLVFYEDDKHQNSQFDIGEQVKALTLGDPEGDVASALGRKDCRFIALAMPHNVVPGVDGKVESKTIVGPHDSVASFAQEQINELAYRYAKRYNAALLAAMKNKK